MYRNGNVSSGPLSITNNLTCQRRADLADELLNLGAIGHYTEAPEHMRITVSLVDIQPSESARLNVVRTASVNNLWARLVSMTASVVTTANIVAMPGAIIPAPLVMPPTEYPSPLAAATL